MRILAIDVGSNCLDWLMRCQEWGHQVLWYDKPRPDGTDRHAGEGIVPKIRDYDELRRKWLGWADLIYTPDNVSYLEMLEPYRRVGYPIYGCNLAAVEWELDREAGQKVMEECGMRIIPGKTFHDYDSAIAYVKKEGKAFVSKPSGDGERAMSYVADSAADMVYMLGRWKKIDKYRSAARQDGFILQEKISGIEMAVGGFFGPDGWSRGWVENWENKKLMNGDLGVNTGEMGCYSADTEVLTKSGWKPWPEVNMVDELATQDEDGHFCYERPSAVVSYDCIEPMMHWSTPYVDLMVTSNHKMYVQDDHARKPFHFREALECANKKWNVMRFAKPMVRGSEDISPEFAELVGAYIADGCVKSSSDRSIVFGNAPAHKEREWFRIISAAGYTPKKYGRDVCINSAYLRRRFENMGKAHEKRVPSEIMNGQVEVQRAFLRGYLIGDGSTRLNNQTATTSSEGLANDLQVIAAQIGIAASVCRRDRIGESHQVNGYTCTNRHSAYEIRFSMRRPNATISPDNLARVPYCGKVYCATVSSHLLYVRRNGKPVWCGNTTVRVVRQSKLADEVLKPATEHLKRIGYVGYVDVNCMIPTDGKGPYPLEWTMRDGWPIRHNLTALIEGDPAQWMVDKLNGRDTLKIRMDEVCISVLMALPDFPYSKITNKELCGIPIYGAEDMEHLHFSEVMMGTAPREVNGKVVDLPGPVTAGDYVLIATGTGETITGARRSAYSAIKKVKIPNSPFYRTDIGVGRLKKQLPDLQQMGYAKGLSY
ncbi:hypothetical protein WM24_28450 [Burkholderia ubonensis]|uniref:LAGLIDADG family homing endonuclease n=1 Tax=Burkholderia ubonensis TaxID=101571 RepID=UPI00075F46D7|nr:LAGLIDADG family homing endonuclease [Burkholderia ubonensis]KWN78997.1 hypothetical protein WM24_28450 [Burkholderia ubonensis]